MGDHINESGKFQSDKYTWCWPGFVPLKITDPMAQPVLWTYAAVRASVDQGFCDDLRACLIAEGYKPPTALGEHVMVRLEKGRLFIAGVDLRNAGLDDLDLRDRYEEIRDAIEAHEQGARMLRDDHDNGIALLRKTEAALADARAVNEELRRQAEHDKRRDTNQHLEIKALKEEREAARTRLDGLRRSVERQAIGARSGQPASADALEAVARSLQAEVDKP